MVALSVTSGHFTSFAHKVLWDSSQRHLSIAGERPQDSWMLHLSAGLLAAAAFEAYLNYLGEEMLPQVWAQERKYFSSEPYRGTAGKLRRIAEEIKWRLPSKSHKPFSGLLELQNLRDKMVHARPKKTSYRRIHKANEFPPVPSTWLYREAPAKRIRTLIADAEAFAVALHSAVLRSEFRNAIFGSHPFLGSLGFGTHSVKARG